jgi:hypothetical protein
MIERKYKWYHHCMLSLTTQLVIGMVCLIIMVAQLVVYSVLEENIVMFDGTCDIVVGTEIGSHPTTMQCGEFKHDLSPQLETNYLHNILVGANNQTVTCIKKQSEYLKSISWNCELKMERPDE